ncbi:MAG TPA: DinB family protein [Acidimicrobiia bacterium]|nr:DinB family protein [Acidimicrobiia bacterium]
MTMLRGWMTHLRASAATKLDDLDDRQLRWKPASTANSCGGIVQHLAYAERWWFRIVFAGEDLPLDFKDDGMRPSFELADDATAASVRSFYEKECAIADAVIDGAALDDWSRADLGRRTTLRWILTHMVEETARHAGHLDITRELIDGRRGR